MSISKYSPELSGEVVQSHNGSVSITSNGITTKYRKMGKGRSAFHPDTIARFRMREVGHGKAQRRVAASGLKTPKTFAPSTPVAAIEAPTTRKRAVNGGYTPKSQQEMITKFFSLDLTKQLAREGVEITMITAKFKRGHYPSKQDALKIRKGWLRGGKNLMGHNWGVCWNLESTHAGQPHYNFLIIATPAEARALQEIWIRVAGFGVGMTKAEINDACFISRNSVRKTKRRSPIALFRDAAAYMSGVSEKLMDKKSHQYELPKGWCADGEGAGKMWGTVGNLSVLTGEEFAISNLRQRKAIDAYMSQQTTPEIAEFVDESTGEVLTFDNGLFRSGRRYGSTLRTTDTAKMRRDIARLLEQFAWESQWPEGHPEWVHELGIAARVGAQLANRG